MMRTIGSGMTFSRLAARVRRYGAPTGNELMTNATGVNTASSNTSSAPPTAQQLAESVARSGVAIFGQTEDGIVTSWNRAAEELFGYTAAEIIGRPIGLIAPPELLHEQTDARARLKGDSHYEELETRRRRKDGTMVDVLFTSSQTIGEHGTVIGSWTIARDVSADVNARRALEASGRRLTDAQRIAHLGSFEYTAATGEIVCSEEFHRILAVEPDEHRPLHAFLALIDPDDQVDLGAAWARCAASDESLDHSFRIVRPDGEVRSVRVRAVVESDEFGALSRVSGTMADQTEWVEAERTRRTAEGLFETGFEQSAIGAVIADLDGLPIRVNAAVREILGRTDDELVGVRWTAFSHPADPALGEAVLTRLQAGVDTYQDERRYIRPDGSIVWAAANVTIVRDDGVPQYAFVQLMDITPRKSMEADIMHQALHDSLTGLPNRTMLDARLIESIEQSRVNGTQVAVMFLDIDQFKVINDSLGHTLGDRLLSEVAKRIDIAIRPMDTVARFGGDEFVIVCNDVTPDEAGRIAHRVIAALRQPWLVDDQEMNMSASLGIAMADEHSTPESLLRDSDGAMYRAKERGRGRIELFDQVLSQRASRRLSISTALHRALERDELTLVYQPIIDLHTGSMSSVETLLRWENGPDGRVSPEEFIPIAEDTALIVPIGAWVLEESCRQMVEWQQMQVIADGRSSLSLAVNLSVRQLLAPDIVGLVARTLARTGLAPDDLCLELTESVFMEDVEYFGRALHELKSLGVTLAIDDFGTGYSSLSYLRRFPVDAVKIDRAFIDGLETDSNDTALVTTIVAMARALGLSITAEGVETISQLRCLQRMEVPEVQGFHLARPMPADAITQLVRESHRWSLPDRVSALDGGSTLAPVRAPTAFASFQLHRSATPLSSRSSSPACPASRD